MTRTLRVDPAHPQPEIIARAAKILRAGGLVAFPTETVYGLGANALDEEAVRGIFEAKGRPAFNPLIAHVSDLEAAKELASLWPEPADRLARAFWPGPLTLVVPRAAVVPGLVTAGLPSVALRVPAHPVALALLRAADVPVAAPSANRYTQLSPTRAAHVERGLGDRVQMILDGGPTAVGIESTVVDLTGDVPVLLRPGTLSREEIEEVVGPVEMAGALAGSAPRPAPGMVERHYAPRAELRVLPADGEGRQLREAVDAAAARGVRSGAVLVTLASLPGAEVRRLPAEPREYARMLYSTLHELDDLGCGLIVVERVPAEPRWAGVRDRLRRAAHPG